MPRLQAVDPAEATGPAQTLLEGVRKRLGLVPNRMRTLASSPAVLAGDLGLSGALGSGRLPALLREQIALAVRAARGGVADDELERVRGAGFGDGEIAEIVAHVALNTLTNDLNRLAGTEVDLPEAPALANEAA